MRNKLHRAPATPLAGARRWIRTEAMEPLHSGAASIQVLANYAHQLLIGESAGVIEMYEEAARSAGFSPSQCAALAKSARSVVGPLHSLIQSLQARVSAPREAGATVVIGMQGGVVQGISADSSCTVHVVDYDAEDAHQRPVPQPDGSFVKGEVITYTALLDPRWVESVASLAAEVTEPS